MKQIQFVQGYLAALGNPAFVSTGVRVSLVVGSMLLLINHGSALMAGNMNRDRWISALLTYLVPYGVSVHGQYSNHAKH